MTYAFDANPLLPTNCWEFGTPDSTNATIRGAFSAPYCWKTVLKGKHPANNESILYSPIFDGGIVKGDTMSFMMRRALNTGSYVQVEVLNYRGEWSRLGARNDGNGINWYNHDLTGSINQVDGPNTPIHYKKLNDLDNSKFQIRFVFRGGGTVNDGIAIDDFQIKRA